MEFRKYLGEKGLSFIGLGCWRFGEEENPPETDNPGKSYWGGQKHTDSIRCMDAAVRGGITHFDTAQSYGKGRSEQFTGQKLSRIRDRVIIASKIMAETGDEDYIRKKVDLSLKRLNSEYIDIIYIHWPYDNMTIRKTVKSLEKMRDKGKIRYIGVSNFSLSNMRSAMDEGKIDFHQTGYSFLWRKSEEEIIPFCVKNGISVIAYSFYAQGLLVSENPETIGTGVNDRRRQLVFFRKNNIPVVEKTVSELKKLSHDTGFSVPALLTGWGKSKPWLDSILTGGRNRKQIEETIEGEKMVIGVDITEKLEKMSRKAVLDTEGGDNIFSHSSIKQD